MRATRTLLLVILFGFCLQLFATAALAQSTQTKQASQAKTEQLLKLVQTGNLTAEKAAAFEELAVYGTNKVIPILAPMLADKQLAHYARYALQANPDPAVDELFREALKTLKGDLLIGVINSIGVRKNADSLKALQDLLSNDSPKVIEATATAIGAIATGEASDILQTALTSAGDASRYGIARGCLVCAENMAKTNQTDAAVAIYDLVRAADIPNNLNMAGLRGAILARQAAGVELLVEQLASDDLDAVNVALRVARESDDPKVLQAIVANLDKLQDKSVALVLLALGDIGNSSVVPLLVKAASAESNGTRLAAIRSLRKIGDVAAVATLWKAALSPDPRITTEAIAALVAIPGAKADAAIVDGLKSKNVAERELALNVIAQRRITSAVPQLLQIAQENDSDMRLLAIHALGETAPQGELSTLVKWVIAARDDNEKAITARALQAACARLPDRDACASQLTGSLASATDAAKTTLLEQLGAMGGPDALQCLADCAKDSSPDTQDAATRILGTWIGSDVGPVLLELAKTIENNKYKIRALRGYIRIASQFGLPHEDKMAMCQNALDVAQRDDERQLVLTVLERNPSATSLGLAVTMLDNPNLKNRAAKVALSISQRLIEEEPKPVADAMQKVLDAKVGAKLMERARGYLKRAKQG